MNQIKIRMIGLTIILGTALIILKLPILVFAFQNYIYFYICQCFQYLHFSDFLLVLSFGLQLYSHEAPYDVKTLFLT